MSVKRATQKLLDEYRSRQTVRAGSLIMTVFGDAIAPRGGTVWIGSLIRALADFGISERLVRTSVYRLVRDGWLKVEQQGRRSYYSLSSEGMREFEQATMRIYGEPRQSWTGDWFLALLADLDAEEKEMVRKQLGRLGFVAISSNVLAHPAPDAGELRLTLARNGLHDRMVMTQSRPLDLNDEETMRRLVHKGWKLNEIDRRYEEFVACFRPVFQALEKSRQVEIRPAFLLRTLLIQEYRRVLLRDPLLPAELLPPGWHGIGAYQLCRNLYRLVCEPADEFMSHAFETADGPLPPPAPEFYDRFGGIG